MVWSFWLGMTCMTVGYFGLLVWERWVLLEGFDELLVGLEE
jgi:hypothetical protein